MESYEKVACYARFYWCYCDWSGLDCLYRLGVCVRYHSGCKLNLIPSISKTLSKELWYCVEYSERYLMSVICNYIWAASTSFNIVGLYEHVIYFEAALHWQQCRSSQEWVACSNKQPWPKLNHPIKVECDSYYCVRYTGHTGSTSVVTS